MAITFINGFMCTCSCDEAKAKRGEDPHPALHNDKGAKGEVGQAKNAAGQPSTIFGGSLSYLNSKAVQPVNAVAASVGAGQSPQPTVDVFV